jgi:diguanylate cyclase (GGDEF)-like protein/PAS domain S-box-containing protein
MAKRKRLTRMPIIMALSIALVLTVFLGTFFAIRQVSHTERESSLIEDEFVREKRELIASRAENLVEYAMIRQNLDEVTYFADVRKEVLIKSEEIFQTMSFAIIEYGDDVAEGLEVVSGAAGGELNFLSGLDKEKLWAIIKGSEKFDGVFIDQSIRAINSDSHVPRLVYARHIPDWNWSLVVYSDLDDMEIFLADFRAGLRRELENQIAFLGFIGMFTLIFAYLMAGHYRNVLKRQIGLFSDFYGNFNKNSKLELEKFRYYELYKIARVTNSMMKSLAQVRAELEANEEKFRGFFELSPDLIYVINFRRGIVEEANPAFLEKLGFNIDEIQSIPVSRLFRSEDGKPFNELYSEIKLKKEIRNLNLSVMSKSGDEIKLEINARFADRGGVESRILHIARDVTERFEAEKKIRSLAFNDFLTDIPNRNNFIGQLDVLLREVSEKDYKFGMAFIDLDRFKQINDTLGHHSGDQLLISVSKRLKESIRATDMLARLGGDEFVILFSEVSSKTSLEIVMRKVMDVFKEPFALSKRRVFVTASIGVSIYPKDGNTAEELIMNSDKAMYHAKDSGRNTYRFYDESIVGYSYEDLNIEAELREAIDKKQFVLHYQPVFSCRKRKYIGIEALIRWNHPDRGLIYPDNFISKAEENGHIVEIGRWVVEQVARDTKRLNDLGFIGNSGINMSSVQLKDGKFIEIINKAIENNGLYLGQLVLELTESLAVSETSENRTFMETLREMGIHMILDDFGTGYSSISQLHKYPLGVVKIDKSFISRMGISDKDMEITASIIEMAHKFNIKVVAEGVETEAQHKALIQMGCDMVQGYYFARPMPILDLNNYLVAYKSKKD